MSENSYGRKRYLFRPFVCRIDLPFGIICF